MSIYIWADTHFNHANIIKYCNRPDANVHEMNERLIALWNAVVEPTDAIYLLGDFAFWGRVGGATDLPPVQSIFERLKGHKHLVVGNHDEKNAAVLKLKWNSVSDIATIREDGKRAVACHYPMESWKGMGKGHLMLHGHSHGNLKHYLPHRFDTGCDVVAAPMSLKAYCMLADSQSFNLKAGEDY